MKGTRLPDGARGTVISPKATTEPSARDLELARFAADIPLDLARRAHAGTSHSPEDSGEQERAGYAETLFTDFNQLEKEIQNLDQSADFRAAFERYRQGYAERYRAMLSAKSRCMSTMITGGSNFPVRRQRKLSDVADKRTNEMLEWRKTQLAAIRKLLHPEDRPIMSGDSDALVRLREKIAEAERLQTTMRSANSVIRRNAKDGKEAQLRELIAIGIGPANARALLEPNDFGRLGFAAYQLSNNNANISRMRERLAQLEVAKSTEATEVQGEHARIEDCPADNRVRLFFPGKPSVDDRAAMMVAGFRWTPSLGCWQAYRNERTIAFAKRKAGISAEAG